MLLYLYIYNTYFNLHGSEILLNNILKIFKCVASHIFKISKGTQPINIVNI